MARDENTVVVGIAGRGSKGISEGPPHEYKTPVEILKEIRLTTDQYPSSIEIHMPASGKITWGVKVYCSAGKERRAKSVALKLFRELEKELVKPSE